MNFDEAAQFFMQIVSHKESLLISDGWNLIECVVPEMDSELLIYILENGTEMQVTGKYTDFGWVIPDHDTYDVIAWKELGMSSDDLS